MLLTSLALVNFRGYASLALPLPAGLTVLAGDNAQGKTNLLRAVEVLALGALPEGEDAWIRWGEGAGRVEGLVEGPRGRDRMAVALRGRGVRLAVNGKAVPRARWVGRLPALFVGPDDRAQVMGPPSARRALLDALLEQSAPACLAALREYRRALRQRNRALADPQAPSDAAEIWEAPLARAGGVVLAHRVAALEELAPRAAAWHRELAGGAGDLSVSYAPTVPAPAAAASPAAWEAALATALARGRERERALGATLVGPHRDEVAIALDGRALKGAGSAGQVWTAVLALALAIAEWLSARLGALPVLLLDDVLGPLDASRRSRLCAVLRGLPQALLTTNATPPEVNAAAMYEVRAHALARATRDGGAERWRTASAAFEASARC